MALVKEGSQNRVEVKHQQTRDSHCTPSICMNALNIEVIDQFVHVYLHR